MRAVEDKRTRILETAIELAERGGFEAVRLRDVAAQADVALGTVYKRFRSKEEILVAALDLESEKLDKRMALKPAKGDNEEERVLSFFETATGHLFRRPNLARAIIRAITSGDAELTAKVAGFHDRITRQIVTALRGEEGQPLAEAGPQATEQMLAFILSQIWFAALVGWMGGLHSKQSVIEQLRVSLRLLLKGVAAGE